MVMMWVHRQQDRWQKIRSDIRQSNAVFVCVYCLMFVYIYKSEAETCHDRFTNHLLPAGSRHFSPFFFFFFLSPTVVLFTPHTFAPGRQATSDTPTFHVFRKRFAVWKKNNKLIEKESPSPRVLLRYSSVVAIVTIIPSS